MNNRIQVFFFILILFSVINTTLTAKLSAQTEEISLSNFFRERVHPYDSADKYDTKLTLIGLSNVEYRYLKPDEILVFEYKHDVNKFTDSTKSAEPVGLDKIDFKKNTLVLFSYHGGDCHARFQFRYSQDDEAKILTVKVYDYYGGCRAGGFFYQLGFNSKTPRRLQNRVQTGYG